ncbi:MAG TPA: glycosyltransferase family 9 protein [Gemmatimonadaceae bacterium]
MDLGGLERAWRRAWMKSIGALSGGASLEAAPDWDARPWSVLYTRTQGIGDLILATGVFRAIALSHPTIALDVLTTPAAAPVLDNNPHVRRVLVVRRTISDQLRVAALLRRSRYDVVIDGKITRGASFVSSPARTMVTGARYRMGVGGGNHHLVFNICVPRFDRTTTHMVEGSAALALPFGVDMATTNWRPEVFLTSGERERADEAWETAARTGSTDGRRWLVNLSAGAPVRRWSDERWVTLISRLRARRPDATIGIIAVEEEREAVRRIASAAGAVALSAPRLRDALALVGTSERVITSNTSITHAASAFTIPTMLLLERGHDQWSSWNSPTEVAYWTGDSVAALDVGSACAALDRFLVSHD